ncbi:uncharacterized protein [Amphiura filiformis]|uniref:uncharacterized protein n=1 Tax=Amphiura filiformis TaxID=82378 RepID=UPI003B228BAC
MLITHQLTHHDDFIVATERACWDLPSDKAEQLRAEIAGTLRSAKPPSSNLTRDERNALRNLQKEKSILILPADKGKATVVVDTDDYESRVNHLLQDEKTYEKMESDPTPKYKRQLIGILSRLKKEKKIDDKQYKSYTQLLIMFIVLYCTNKIHKEGNPVRPIVDYTGTIGYETSRELADILAPLVGNSVHHVKNSKQLAEDMARG